MAIRIVFLMTLLTVAPSLIMLMTCFTRIVIVFSFLRNALSLQGVWHRFDSDRRDQHYGDEWNLIASAKLRRTQLSVRYARYDAHSFATDSQKLWLQADWSL